MGLFRHPVSAPNILGGSVPRTRVCSPKAASARAESTVDTGGPVTWPNLADQRPEALAVKQWLRGIAQGGCRHRLHFPFVTTRIFPPLTYLPIPALRAVRSSILSIRSWQKLSRLKEQQPKTSQAFTTDRAPRGVHDAHTGRGHEGGEHGHRGGWGEGVGKLSRRHRAGASAAAAPSGRASFLVISLAVTSSPCAMTVPPRIREFPFVVKEVERNELTSPAPLCSQSFSLNTPRLWAMEQQRASRATAGWSGAGRGWLGDAARRPTRRAPRRAGGGTWGEGRGGGSGGGGGCGCRCDRASEHTAAAERPT